MRTGLKIFIVLAVLLLTWMVICETNWANTSPRNVWLANPYEVMMAMSKIFSSEIEEILFTFKRVFLSSLLAICFGVLTGILIGYYSTLYKVLKPYIDFWRSIPPIVIIPILFYLDTSYPKENMRLMLVFFGCFPILTMLIADAVADASKERLLIFKSISPSFLFKIKNVIGFEIMPNFYTGLRAIFSFSIIIIIVSEMVISPEFGIGKKIIHYQTAYEIQYVYAYSIILGIIGLLLNLSLLKLKKLTIKWRPE